MFQPATSSTFGYGSGNSNYNNGPNGGDEPKENVRHFAELLFELSKYDHDLKAILDNSKLSVNQNQNTVSMVNPYTCDYNSIQNPFLKHENSEKNFNLNENGGNNIEDKNNTIENNANISESNPIVADITADSIYNLLASQHVIIVDVSKLPKSLKQIVNKLTNSNSLDNKNDAQSVVLSPDQFQELIYYFIINAVAKDRGIFVPLSNQNQDNKYNNIATNQVIYSNYQETPSLPVNKNTNKTYGSILEKMRTNFYSKNTNDAYQVYTDYRSGINENRDLKQFITNKSDQQGISINFWGLFLWDVLKRASFSYSLYKAIRNNHRKDKIDAVLGLPHVLFILSLIFGWGAIANAILGFIFLVSLVYKAINQYQQTKPKYLLYSLLGTKTFYDIANRLDRALVPEVGNFYKFYIQGANQVTQQELYVNEKIKAQYQSQQQNSFYSSSQYQYPQYQNSQYTTFQQG